MKYALPFKAQLLSVPASSYEMALYCRQSTLQFKPDVLYLSVFRNQKMQSAVYLRTGIQ